MVNSNPSWVMVKWDPLTLPEQIDGHHWKNDIHATSLAGGKKYFISLSFKPQL